MGEEKVFLEKKETKEKVDFSGRLLRVSGKRAERMIFRSSHGVPPFRGLCWLCYFSFSVYLFFFSWLSFTVIKRCNFRAFILLLNEL